MREPSRTLAGVILVASFLALAVWSWGRWTDPVIDFGFELYVPWRILEGEVLYRDIAYRNGPLSSYWNAALFAMFGVSLRTLVFANLATLAAITLLLFDLLERSLSRIGALTGCAAFLAICAFSQYGTVGNYNFVTPYQHGQTHGLLLGLAIVSLLSRASRGDGLTRWATAGVLLGLLSLTKVEMWVPAAAVAACATGLEFHRSGPAARRSALALTAAALTPPLVAWALLSLAMPGGNAGFAVLGNWPYLWDALLHQPFYRDTAGFDAPVANLLETAAACAVLGVAAVGIRACDRRGRGRSVGSGAITSVALIAGGAAGATLPLPWDALARALPVAMLLAVAIWFAPALRDVSSARTGLLLAGFALLLLAKLGLASQVQHYGFALAAPALATSLAAAVTPWQTPLARGLSIGLIAAVASALLTTAHAIYTEKDHPLGSGADQILVAGPEASPRGVSMERLLRGMDAIMEPDATLLVLPEGAGVNYWLRRANPTRYSLFLPTEQAAHGGPAPMIASLREHPPDFVVLIHRGHEEFGTGPFLSDPRYGEAFHNWLERGYSPVQQIGAPPFQGAAFGIVVLQRRAASP